jgi:1-aminocyclopropane-1-carboxylate deaminase/D-cysteine desulfhydrase-like pyridoxal-dependent ACC family enzyme
MPLQCLVAVVIAAEDKYASNWAISAAGAAIAQASYLHGSIVLEQDENKITADKKTKKRFINFKILANIEETNQNVQLTISFHKPPVQKLYH